MRKLFYFILVLFLVSACGRRDKNQEAVQAEPIDTTAQMVNQINMCSRLYTSEYKIRKIILFDDPAAISFSFLNKVYKIGLPLGQRSVAIPVTATVKTYVDLGKLTKDNIIRDGQKVEIVLPDPQVMLTATHIDHTHIVQNISFFRSHFNDGELALIEQQGRKDIIKSMGSLNILEDARTSAARQLVPIVTAMGFDERNITVTFRKGLTIRDLSKLIKQID